MAVDFLTMIVFGRIDEAYNTYVDFNGKHHNVYFPQGFQNLQKAMKENHVQFPNKQFDIKQVIADGDKVAVHSNVRLSADKNIAVVHILRFKNQKIVEMWDVGQLLPTDLPNADGAF